MRGNSSSGLTSAFRRWEVSPVWARDGKAELQPGRLRARRQYASLGRDRGFPSLTNRRRRIDPLTSRELAEQMRVVALNHLW